MRPSYLTFRLFAETVAIIASVEGAIMFLLPVIAPGVGIEAGAMLDTAMLTLASGPLILWRMSAAVKRAHGGLARGNGKGDAVPTEARRLTVATSLTVLAAVLGCSVFGAWRINEGIRASGKARFQQLAERLETEVERRIGTYADGLRGTRGFYAGSKSVERGEFRAFIASHDLPHELPGAQGFGFIQRVQRADLDKFVAAERADETPDFAVRTSGDADELFIIKFIEPLEKNSVVWGRDIATDPVRREAAERAMLTGEPALSGRVNRNGDAEDTHRFGYYLAVYRNGTHPGTPEERRRDLVGWVYVSMGIEELLAGVTGGAEGLLDLKIYDGPEMTTSTLLFDGDLVPHVLPDTPTAKREEASLFRKRTATTMGGRQWTLWVGTTAAFDDARDRSSPALVGVGGTLIGVLLALLVWSLASGRARAEALAQEMTIDLAVANRRTEMLLNSAGEGVLGLDLDGRTTLANPAAVRMFGYRLDEIIGQPQHDLIHHTKPDGSPYPREECPIYAAFADGKVHHIDSEVFWRKDGTSFPVAYTSTPIRDENGTLQGAVVVFRDITEGRHAAEMLRTAHRELTRSNTELEQFAYVASHDLQQPLRMVASYVQLLERRYKDKLDAKAEEFIGYAVDGTIRMKRLINDLLTYSRVGTHGKSFEPTDCERILSHTLKLLEVAVHESGAEITHEPLPTVIGDETQLVQLFQNLIDNAIKYRGDRPPAVHVRAERQGQNWLFSVRDNGIGIDSQYADRIFLIFQRLHGKDEYTGTGIGLAVCKKVVERHGGRLWMESQAGKGTTFHFTIPYKEIPVHETDTPRKTDRDLVGGGRTR